MRSIDSRPDFPVNDLFALNGHYLLESSVLAEQPAASRSKDLPDFLDLPNPYLKAAQPALPAGEPTSRLQDKKDEKPPEKHHDWFHDACDWVSGAADVAAQVTIGAVSKVCEAVTEHPWQTAVMLAEGAAIGVAVVAAAPVAAALGASAAVVGGISLCADAAIAGLTLTGAVAAGGDVVKAAKDSSLSADVLMHKSLHTDAEIAAARLDVQSKTGTAALEAAATITMSGAAWGSGARLVSAASEALNGARSAMSGTELSALVAESRGAEGALSMRQQPPWVKDAALDRVNLSQARVPYDSGPELIRQIDHKIYLRQREVDLKSLSARLRELGEQRPDNITVNDSMNGPRTLTNAELVDRVGTRELLRGQPQAQQYEEFLRNFDESKSLLRQIDDELALRRRLVGDLLNEHATAIFPDRVVPKLEVLSLEDPNPNVQAAYGRGKLYLRDTDLHQPSYYDDDMLGARTADSIVHEMVHGEQDGLVIRNLIDLATGGDTTGRSLTADETAAIQDMARQRTGGWYSEEMIEDVNGKRAGRVLSPAEVRRAKGLESSMKAESDSHLVRRETKAALKDMDDEYRFIQAKGLSPKFFSERYQSVLFGKNGPPPKIREIKDLFDQLPESESLQRAFADLAQPSVLDAIKDETVRLERLIDEQYAAYRSWQHETEAWKIGGQAANEVIELDVLAGGKLQEQVDQHTAHPIDYSDIIVY
jgi:hypothetical protein